LRGGAGGGRKNRDANAVTQTDLLGWMGGWRKILPFRGFGLGKILWFLQVAKY